MDGAELIAVERKRQTDSIGWDADHDDDHFEGELWHAARCYLSLDPANLQQTADLPAPRGWPWDQGDFKPKSRVENLVRAGALIAAEIDRLRRDSPDA